MTELVRKDRSGKAFVVFCFLAWGALTWVVYSFLMLGVTADDPQQPPVPLRGAVLVLSAFVGWIGGFLGSHLLIREAIPGFGRWIRTCMS